MAWQQEIVTTVHIAFIQGVRKCARAGCCGKGLFWTAVHFCCVILLSYEVSKFHAQVQLQKPCRSGCCTCDGRPLCMPPTNRSNCIPPLLKYPSHCNQMFDELFSFCQRLSRDFKASSFRPDTSFLPISKLAYFHTASPRLQGAQALLQGLRHTQGESQALYLITYTVFCCRFCHDEDASITVPHLWPCADAARAPALGEDTRYMSSANLTLHGAKHVPILVHIRAT